MIRFFRYCTLGGLLAYGCANFTETRNEEPVVIQENDIFVRYMQLSRQGKLEFLEKAVIGEHVSVSFKPLNRTGTRYCSEMVKGYGTGLLIVIRDDRGLEPGIDEMVEITCAQMRNDALKRRQGYDLASMQERSLLDQIPSASENNIGHIKRILGLVREEKEQAYELTNENLTLFPVSVMKDGVMISYGMKDSPTHTRVAIVFNSVSDPKNARKFLVSEDLRTTYQELNVGQEEIDLFLELTGIVIITGEKGNQGVHYKKIRL